MGADVDTPMKDGETPVFIAAQNGHTDAIQVLKGFGADVNTPMEDGRTPVHAAAHNGHADAIQVLKELGADVDTAEKMVNLINDPLW